MPATAVRRRARHRQLEDCTPLVAIAIARQVIDEASRWLGEPLPARYAAGLAHRARRFFVHSPRHRRRWIASPDAGRDWLYTFMRHWLAARLHTERPALHARLPHDYNTGAPLALPPLPARHAAPRVAVSSSAHGFTHPGDRLAWLM